MKLLIVTPALGDVYGGTSKCVVELAQALSQFDITVDLVTTNANGTKTIETPLETWLPRSGYRVQFFSYKGWGDYKFSASLSQWLFKNIQNYDLVQINAIFSIPNLAAYWACRWKNIPYVVIPHGMLDPWALSYKAWKKRVYYSLLEKPALQRASALQMLAGNEAEQIQSLNLSPPSIISPNGIHRQDFEELPDAELLYQQFPETRGKRLILFLGRIDPKKGFDFLAQAFGEAYRQFPNAHLVVAGPDNVGFLPTVEAYFAKHDCLDAVTFTGMLTGEMKHAALAAAYCYIAPSYSEGFSMSVLEGMAAGLPCIITEACNFPEAEKANAAYVVSVDADAITTALCHCLKDSRQATVVGRRARDFILNNYTWDEIAGNLHSVYRSILNQQLLPHYAR